MPHYPSSRNRPDRHLDARCSTMDDRVPPKTQRWRDFAIAGSVLLCFGISSCQLIQPDWLTPLILVPTWCWLIVGLMLAVCGYRRNHRLRFIAVLALWGLFIALFVEEAYSLVRRRSWPTAEWQAAREHGRGIRVVSLNCEMGQSRSVEEVARWNPDIVLLQESPSSEQLEHLSRALFGADGAFLHGGDVSILANGPIQSKFSNRASHFVHAELELSSGLMVDVMSVRLAPPVSRLDFWMPDFWVDHRDGRIKHRDQILDIVQHVRAVPASSHLIVGGDFNSPPYDDSLAPLQRRLFDTFRKAGRGWGVKALL